LASPAVTLNRSAGNADHTTAGAPDEARQSEQWQKAECSGSPSTA
jgi:hypothetical protein